MRSFRTFVSRKAILLTLGMGIASCGGCRDDNKPVVDEAIAGRKGKQFADAKAEAAANKGKRNTGRPKVPSGTDR